MVVRHPESTSMLAAVYGLKVEGKATCNVIAILEFRCSVTVTSVL